MTSFRLGLRLPECSCRKMRKSFIGPSVLPTRTYSYLQASAPMRIASSACGALDHDREQTQAVWYMRWKHPSSGKTMKPQLSLRVTGNQSPAPSPGCCGLLLKHPSAQQTLFLPRTCAASHERTSCAQPPTPQGNRCTPRRTHAVPNEKSPLRVTLLTPVSRRRDQIPLSRIHSTPHYEKYMKVKAVESTQRCTARQSNRSLSQVQAYKSVVLNHLNKRTEENHFRREVADCSLHGERESTPAGEALLEKKPPVSMESRVHTEDYCTETVHSAGVSNDSASSDGENLIIYKLTEKRGKHLKNPDHGRRASPFSTAVSSSEDTKHDNTIHTTTTTLNGEIRAARFCDYKLACCRPIKLHAYSGFTISNSEPGPNAAQASKKEPVIAYEPLLHPATIRVHPHSRCRQRHGEDDNEASSRTTELEEIPPSPRGRRDEPTAAQQCHQQGKKSPRHGRDATDPEGLRNGKQEYSEAGCKARVLRISASSAAYEHRYGVPPSRQLRNSSVIEHGSPQRGARRTHTERPEDFNAESSTACQMSFTPSENRKGLRIDTADKGAGTATHRLRNDSTLSLGNRPRDSDLSANDRTTGGGNAYALPAEHGRRHPPQKQRSESRLRKSPRSQPLKAPPVALPPSSLNHPNACQFYGPKGEEIVTHEQIVSLLESCSKRSIYGPDVERDDPSSSPFHSSRQPSISLRNYYFNRIVKYSQMSPTDLVMSVVYINKLLTARSPKMSADHSAAAMQLWVPSPLHPPKFDMKNRDSNPSGKHKPVNGRIGIKALVTQPDASPTAFTANEAVEFNALTAHRLLLTASLLANKVHYDRHLVLKHWAKLGGLEKEEVVNLEATFLRVIDWRVRVSVEDFLLVRIVHPVVARPNCTLAQADTHSLEVLRENGEERSEEQSCDNRRKPVPPQTRGTKSRWRLDRANSRGFRMASFFVQTCERIRLADCSLLLKSPPVEPLQQFQQHWSVSSQSRNLKQNSCARGRGGNPLTTRSLCCVSESENDGVHTSPVLGTSDGSTASSLSLLSNSDPPERLVRAKTTTSQKGSCVAQHLPQIQYDEGDKRPAQELYADDAATKHRTRQERCSASGQARRAFTDFNKEVQLMKTQLHSGSPQELQQHNCSTINQCKLYNSLIHSAVKTCVGPSVPSSCSKITAHTSVSLQHTDAKVVAEESPGSPNASSLFQPADHLMEVQQSKDRPADARTPEFDEHTTSHSFSSTIRCQRSTRSGLIRPTNRDSSQYRSPPRKSIHAEITESARGRNSALTASMRHRGVVASNLAYRRDCQDVLHRIQAGSLANSTDKRLAAEPFSDTYDRGRHGILPTCILCTPNRASACERTKSEAQLKPSEGTLETCDVNVTVPMWQSSPMPKTAVGHSGCHTGSNCGVIREGATIHNYEAEHDTLRIGSSALAPRLSPEFFVDEWRTTTATAFKGVPGREELGFRHTPRPTLSKLPREQHVHRGHAHHFQSQLPAASLGSRSVPPSRRTWVACARRLRQPNRSESSEPLIKTVAAPSLRPVYGCSLLRCGAYARQGQHLADTPCYVERTTPLCLKGCL